MDKATEKSVTSQSGTAVSRRDFLKVAGLTLAGLATGLLIPDSSGNTLAGNLGTRLIADFFAQKNNNDADETLRLIQRETGESYNSNHRPYLEILIEGVDEFRLKNPTIPIIWNKSPLYVGDYKTISLLTKPIEEREIHFYPERDKFVGKNLLECIKNVIDGGDPSVPYSVFYNRLPEEIQNVINTVNTNMAAFPGTELYVNFYPKLGNVFSHEDVTEYYEQIKRDIENIYTLQNRQEPLSLSRLIVYFLEKNNGKLHPALGDMAGFSKYLIRGDDTDEGVVQIEWYRSHIQDQIIKNFSLNKIGPIDNLKGSSLINSVKSIWGLLYHAPSLVYLLSYMSPDLIRLATIYEYVSHGHEAGGYKLKVDTEFMNGLDRVDTYLQSFH